MILRPYQRECVDVLSRTLLTKPVALVVLPTAGGKTLIFTEFLKKWERPGRKFLVIVNRGELVTQTYNRFKAVFDSVSVYSAGFGEKSLDGNIIIASIQSLDDVVIDNLACVVLDEVHNFGNMEGRYGRFLEAHPTAKVIGFTATPWNNNKPIYGDDKFFPDITFKVGLNDLIKGGFILPPLLKAPPHQIDTSTMRTRLGEYMQEDVDKLTLDVNKIKAQVADALPRIMFRKKILWVCASIEHATILCGAIQAAGETAAIIHSKQVAELQSIQRNKFENGNCRHMCCVMMATEGYDFPAIDAICFMRPTKSATLFTQVIGRSLRLSPGKKDALILDYGNVVENCGPLDDPRIINYRPDMPKEAMKYTTWSCPNCMSYVEVPNLICMDCGYEKEVVKRDVLKNLDYMAKTHDHIEVMFGADTGTFKVNDLEITVHVGRKSKKPSIKISYGLDGRKKHDDYITENQWRFKWRDVHALCYDVPFDFFKAYDYLEGGRSLKKWPKTVTLTKNEKGFYKVTPSWD